VEGREGGRKKKRRKKERKGKKRPSPNNNTFCIIFIIVLLVFDLAFFYFLCTYLLTLFYTSHSNFSLRLLKHFLFLPLVLPRVAIRATLTHPHSIL